MNEIKFEKKTLVEAINTTLQETEQTAAKQSVAPPGVAGFMSAGMKAEAPQHWGNYRSLLSFWVIRSLGGWLSNGLHQSQRTQGS
ncbi:MAG: hypothetical protein Q7T85_09920 [Nitrosomonas sp.]|nr:hypothetical protein [Nitrosomonas sp.]